LQAHVTPVNQISEVQILTMLRIMQTYYLNVDAVQFRTDLKEKDLVILLHEEGAIRGFSTWLLTEHEMPEQKVNIIFSGDTIIEKAHWHSLALPIAWGRLMLSALARYPDRELYWVLTSKGHKTYRFLPVFFREFYPAFMKNTPVFEEALLHSFASHRFGNRFNPATGTLTASDKAQKLIPGVADITEARRKDKHVAFFERMNPGCTQGDELVCLARCHPDNISPFIKRYLKT
ncbi:MAG: hypothetical protein U1B77_04875, partial [Dehalococcoidales bacterium]|nr:hypothetical protein [Dehalococcoidales bacterium]